MISVIIPHLNQPEALEACLASLDDQTLDSKEFEVIVVDNGSQPIPVEVLARHPAVLMLLESRPGPGPARNTGASKANGDILAFIDADCRADPYWLEAIKLTLDSSAPDTVLGGDVRIWPSGDDSLGAIEAYENVFAYRFKFYIERHGYAGTGNLAMFRHDFEAVGTFGGIELAEDMEWGNRACAKGLRFRFVPEMVVFHPARASLQDLYVKWDRQILHYRKAADGKPAWRLRWVARALMVLASPAAGVVTVLTSDRIQGFAARRKAIAVMVAVRVHRAMTMFSLLRRDRAVVWNR